MARRHRTPSLIVLLALIVTACRAAPIYNPRIEFPARNPDTVEQAILKALANRRWLATKDAPGVITGTLNLRSHQAVVRIEYTDNSYSIRYAGSTELLYQRKPNGEEVIHQNYNSWVKNLVRDINTSLGVPIA
ncbi:MAG: hypothetical protein HYR72_07935 [Deltaproteobacteria bacterium]|nr:hypothetical protein [Deltaproteobacteria bacterium]MBI3387020.1 hypothetical protein [Deltaproteobacteria bacterium]